MKKIHIKDLIEAISEAGYTLVIITAGVIASQLGFLNTHDLNQRGFSLFVLVFFIIVAILFKYMAKDLCRELN